MTEQHPDDIAVDEMAKAIKEKLRISREEKGRTGWQTCPPEELSAMLRHHIEKGDPVDVAAFCVFLHSLGKGISPETPIFAGVPKFEHTGKKLAWNRHYNDFLETLLAKSSQCVMSADHIERISKTARILTNEKVRVIGG